MRIIIITRHHVQRANALRLENRSTYNSMRSCPAALALADFYPGKHIYVTDEFAFIDYVRFTLSKEVQTFMHAWVNFEALPQLPVIEIEIEELDHELEFS